jgi:hypothetical protein
MKRLGVIGVVLVRICKMQKILQKKNTLKE